MPLKLQQVRSITVQIWDAKPFTGAFDDGLTQSLSLLFNITQHSDYRFKHSKISILAIHILTKAEESCHLRYIERDRLSFALLQR